MDRDGRRWKEMNGCDRRYRGLVEVNESRWKDMIGGIWDWYNLVGDERR